ncbi:MAG: type II toxin-antitoxin system VapC family toxin [Saprospirales bacterium]|nr:type II toxin-antitoxin system VapC family toxin [Saprospirales bacterium]MBK8489801.1 type II toxin-antitoxin system VapC family toxin [Saprospirales bacterium]
MKKIVLDTSAYSRLMQGEKRVEQALNEADKIYIPLFVVAELLLGFKNGDREAENRAILEKFESMPTVERLFPTDETIEIFSDIFSSLKKAGKPIPVHDIWIAALAIETGSMLVHFDKHFEEVEKARLWGKE